MHQKVAEIKRSLSNLKKGDTGIVSSLEGAHSLAMRLRETGFTPGTPVKMVMKTPFGDPVIYELRGTHIALRKNEAACINLG